MKHYIMAGIATEVIGNRCKFVVVTDKPGQPANHLEIRNNGGNGNGYFRIQVETPDFIQNRHGEMYIPKESAPGTADACWVEFNEPTSVEYAIPYTYAPFKPHLGLIDYKALMAKAVAAGMHLCYPVKHEIKTTPVEILEVVEMTY